MGARYAGSTDMENMHLKSPGPEQDHVYNGDDVHDTISRHDARMGPGNTSPKRSAYSSIYASATNEPVKAKVQVYDNTNEYTRMHPPEFKAHQTASEAEISSLEFGRAGQRDGDPDNERNTSGNARGEYGNDTGTNANASEPAIELQSHRSSKFGHSEETVNALLAMGSERRSPREQLEVRGQRRNTYTRPHTQDHYHHYHRTQVQHYGGEPEQDMQLDQVYPQVRNRQVSPQESRQGQRDASRSQTHQHFERGMEDRYDLYSTRTHAQQHSGEPEQRIRAATPTQDPIVGGTRNDGHDTNTHNTITGNKDPVPSKYPVWEQPRYTHEGDRVAHDREYMDVDSSLPRTSYTHRNEPDQSHPRGESQMQRDESPGSGRTYATGNRPTGYRPWDGRHMAERVHEDVREEKRHDSAYNHLDADMGKHFRPGQMGRHPGEMYREPHHMDDNGRPWPPRRATDGEIPRYESGGYRDSDVNGSGRGRGFVHDGAGEIDRSMQRGYDSEFVQQQTPNVAQQHPHPHEQQRQQRTPHQRPRTDGHAQHPYESYSNMAGDSGPDSNNQIPPNETGYARSNSRLAGPHDSEDVNSGLSNEAFGRQGDEASWPERRGSGWQNMRGGYHREYNRHQPYTNQAHMRSVPNTRQSGSTSMGGIRTSMSGMHRPDGGGNGPSGYTSIANTHRNGNDGDNHSPGAPHTRMSTTRGFSHPPQNVAEGGVNGRGSASGVHGVMNDSHSGSRGSVQHQFADPQGNVSRQHSQPGGAFAPYAGFRAMGSGPTYNHGYMSQTSMSRGSMPPRAGEGPRVEYGNTMPETRRSTGQGQAYASKGGNSGEQEARMRRDSHQDPYRYPQQRQSYSQPQPQHQRGSMSYHPSGYANDMRQRQSSIPNHIEPMPPQGQRRPSSVLYEQQNGPTSQRAPPSQQQNAIPDRKTMLVTPAKSRRSRREKTEDTEVMSTIGGVTIILKPRKKSEGHTPRQARCTHCGTTETTTWRRQNGDVVCNACGLYYKTKGMIRPLSVQRAVNRGSKNRRTQYSAANDPNLMKGSASGARQSDEMDRDVELKDGGTQKAGSRSSKSINKSKLPKNNKAVCAHCDATDTTLWRHINNEVVCNPCGLYYGAWGCVRPPSAKRRRNSRPSKSDVSDMDKGGSADNSDSFSQTKSMVLDKNDDNKADSLSRSVTPVDLNSVTAQQRAPSHPLPYASCNATSSPTSVSADPSATPPAVGGRRSTPVERHSTKDDICADRIQSRSPNRPSEEPVKTSEPSRPLEAMS